MVFSPFYAPDPVGFAKPLAKDKETEWFLRLSKGDSRALDVLVKHNMRLVVHVAKRYQNIDDSEEMISVGSVGLLKAIRCFRVEKGTRFSTFAAKCIENEILMYLRANKHNQQNVSIYAAVGVDKDGNEVSLLDTLYNEATEVGAAVEKQETTDLIHDAMAASLDSRERRVIVLRYGLFGYDRVPQREIALREGISRSYISRIEKKALGKLKEYMEKLGIDKDLI